MSNKREILLHTQNPALRERARDVPISEITSLPIRALITDMKELLVQEKYGVALAAPQLGEPLRIFIVSSRALSERSETGERLKKDQSAPTYPDQVYINPVVLKISRGKKGKHEGCLSIRGKWGVVPRAEKASIRAFDEQGQIFTRGASGFLAHIFQHEMDHLEGILYTDKTTELYDETEEERAGASGKNNLHVEKE